MKMSASSQVDDEGRANTEVVRATQTAATSNRWIQAVILVEVDGRRTFPRLQSPGLAHVWSVARMLL
jgi:hypothetical protein